MNARGHETEVQDAYQYTAHDHAERQRRSVRAVCLRAAAIGCADRRNGGRGDHQRHPAARRARLRRPGGPGVRRPPRDCRGTHAVGAPAGCLAPGRRAPCPSGIRGTGLHEHAAALADCPRVEHLSYSRAAGPGVRHLMTARGSFSAAPLCAGTRRIRPGRALVPSGVDYAVHVIRPTRVREAAKPRGFR